MKKKGFLLFVLTSIIVSGVFAQSINGLWRTAVGNVNSIYDGKAVITETNDRGWREAEKRGNISIGGQVIRNIRSTGNLTWTGQFLLLSSSNYATSWAGNATFTMNPDGRTMHVQYQNAGNSGTWTRISNNEIDGLWRTAVGNVNSIYDGKAVITETNDRGWREAERRGNISIGGQVIRNIRSTGNLTWSGQFLLLSSSNYATSWAGNVTFKMNPDGRTMHVQYQNAGNSGTWTRIQ